MERFLEKYEIRGLSSKQRNLLKDFARTVHKENFLYNLTGHRSVEDIEEDLVCRSIAPLKELHVPRGTSAADLGSGAGVPGIPLSIVFPEANWTLFDSNGKKVNFINNFAQSRGLVNLKASVGRVEDLGRSNDFRGSFNFAVSRAMASPYICAELGAPLIKKGGFLYLYSSLKAESLSKKIIQHGASCGLTFVDHGEEKNLAIGDEGLLFVKKMMTDKRFPRRFSVIKREAKEAEEGGFEKP